MCVHMCIGGAPSLMLGMLPNKKSFLYLFLCLFLSLFGNVDLAQIVSIVCMAIFRGVYGLGDSKALDTPVNYEIWLDFTKKYLIHPTTLSNIISKYSLFFSVSIS